MTLTLEELSTERTSDEVRENRFQFQCRMLEQGFQEVQTQIGRLDDIAFRIQAGAATAWAALVGWSFTTQKAAILQLGVVLVLGFWLLEGMFRAVQARYIGKARELSRFLNDRETLDSCFARRELPQGLVYPVASDQGEWRNLILFLRSLVSSRVATLYLFLGLASVLAWLMMDLGTTVQP